MRESARDDIVCVHRIEHFPTYVFSPQISSSISVFLISTAGSACHNHSYCHVHAFEVYLLVVVCFFFAMKFSALFKLPCVSKNTFFYLLIHSCSQSIHSILSLVGDLSLSFSLSIHTRKLNATRSGFPFIPVCNRDYFPMPSTASQPAYLLMLWRCNAQCIHWVDILHMISLWRESTGPLSLVWPKCNLKLRLYI